MKASDVTEREEAVHYLERAVKMDSARAPYGEKGELHSLVSERDLRLVLRPGTEKGERTVRDACHEEPELYLVGDDTPLDQVLTTMAERHIGSCVVARDGHLAGILTVTDVCRHLAALLRDRFGDSTPGKPTDAA